MTSVEKWKPSGIQYAATKEDVFTMIREGYRLCIEPITSDGACFLEEGYRDIGQDRPRIMCKREAAEEAVASGHLRRMSDNEVRAHVQVSPIGRAFYLAVL